MEQMQYNIHYIQCRIRYDKLHWSQSRKLKVLQQQKEHKPMHRMNKYPFLYTNKYCPVQYCNLRHRTLYPPANSIQSSAIFVFNMLLLTYLWLFLTQCIIYFALYIICFIVCVVHTHNVSTILVLYSGSSVSLHGIIKVCLI